MDRRSINFFHGQLLTTADWLLSGRDNTLQTSKWPEGKPSQKPSKGVKRQKRLIPLPEPHSTREKPTSRILTGKIDRRSQEIHSIILKLPESLKLAFYCFYLRRMDFNDASTFTGLTSSQVGKNRYLLIKAISE